jgi:hypothetical protein
LLTAAALAARMETRKLALGWMLLVDVAALVTTASKVAFIGWGLGWAAINFTGVSGHAMFASAIYPILLVSCLSGATLGQRRVALAIGCAMALMVGISRIEVGAHSLSEVVAGLLLGGSVSAIALSYVPSAVLTIRPVVLALTLAWVAVTPFQLHASQTHSLVTRLALAMSGHDAPHTRAKMLRDLHLQNPASV